jgi:hypothetical protein
MLFVLLFQEHAAVEYEKFQSQRREKEERLEAFQRSVVQRVKTRKQAEQAALQHISFENAQLERDILSRTALPDNAKRNPQVSESIVFMNIKTNFD